MATRQTEEGPASGGGHALALGADGTAELRITRNPRDVVDTLAALEALVDLEVPVEVNVVACRWNLDQIVPVVDRVADLAARPANEDARRCWYADLEQARGLVRALKRSPADVARPEG